MIKKTAQAGFKSKRRREGLHIALVFSSRVHPLVKRFGLAVKISSGISGKIHNAQVKPNTSSATTSAAWLHMNDKLGLLAASATLVQYFLELVVRLTISQL